MGSLLVAGITASLRGRLPLPVNEMDLHRLAERIAGGAELDNVHSAAQRALIDGFSGVLMYGALGVWLLSLASYLLFNWRVNCQRESPQSMP